MKIEVFSDDEIIRFEENVNKFIENKTVVDIKYSTCWNKIDKTMDFSAMIIYKT
jgi:hypothetical protein